MIIFNIVLNDTKKAESISLYIIKQKYALQTHIDTNKIITTTGHKKTIHLFFITKALLFNTIEKDIEKEFFNKNMIIYATPVSHINEEFGELLRKNIKAI